MAVAQNLEKVVFKILLNVGMSDGHVKTKSVSLPEMDVDRFDLLKADNIARLLEPLFAYDVYEVRVDESSLVERV